MYSITGDGSQYYFVKNLQGDVVQIRSIYGTVVVEYAYDAWGNVLSITGMYADTRPEDARGGDALSPILFGDIFLKREWLIHQK